VQRSFDDLGTPLHDVTFCVVDIETTGGAPDDGGITEIGAVKLRGGECLGTFSTLVNPGATIPPAITVLTGITDSMVRPAPSIDAVLPSFLEFAAGCVMVGHNVRYDRSFLDGALRRSGYERLPHRFVDTCALARRLLADEVPNHRLGTLADRLRLSHRPTHRALDDALATGQLLHVLLERAGTLGVLGLDDLLELPTIKGHPQLAKLRLTDRLPRSPGVYLFRDVGGRVLYVGKATNLRSRVRSYFSGDDRRKIGQLLRETAAVDHVVTPTTLEAAVLEVRLIHQHLPRFNRRSTTWRRYAYLKLTLGERFPRLSVVRTPKADGGLYLGPLPSSGAARRVAEAIESAAPLRRCTKAPGRDLRTAPCAPAQLGVSSCPCAGAVSEDEYRAIVDHVVRGLTSDPAALLAPLEHRMHALAADDRFEEAADVRDRAAALADALRRQGRLDALRRAGRIELRTATGDTVAIEHGRLGVGGTLALVTVQDDLTLPLARDAADEVSCIAAWLDQEAHRVELLDCDGSLASPVTPIPRFEPGHYDAVAASSAAAAFETATSRASTSAARPSSIDEAAASNPSAIASTMPATTSPAAALSTTMSRWGPGLPAST
jgi:DNA polymerase-3 subunit epsilon